MPSCSCAVNTTDLARGFLTVAYMFPALTIPSRMGAHSQQWQRCRLSVPTSVCHLLTQVTATRMLETFKQQGVFTQMTRAQCDSFLDGQRKTATRALALQTSGPQPSHKHT
jgi:hypothetical protein